MTREADERTIRVNGALRIPRSELETRATRGGGPGGQHVNTSSTRVEVAWNVTASAALTAPQRARILAALSSRLDSAGLLHVVASDTRSQRQNRLLAEERLADLVRRALVVPKVRKPTRPTRAAVERRLALKKRHSKKKQDRKPGSEH